jgi:hypothetical protein
MSEERPSFRKPKGSQIYSSPEELFTKLPNRDRSHGYLRAPQVDALRAYAESKKDTDVAFELPTGTGKTIVGLLIAEWRRRQSGEKVAYLTLTNQLAKQVLKEAEKLGIACADITGTKETRDPIEVGRYQTGKAVGITTYANLFNVNPVVKASDVLVFDDAHGGAHSVADMWTVRIRKQENADLYDEIVTILRPVLTDNQYRIITDGAEYGAVELVDVHVNKAVAQNATTLLDNIKAPEIYFPWNVIRNTLHACLWLASINEIVIRPLIPPTYTHEAFSNTKQRIYMSATLGGEGDLKRSYGITSIKTIRVQHAQWGKRYIFIPGLYMDEDDCHKVIADIWRTMETRRMLMLAPSYNIGQKAYKAMSQKMNPKPTRLDAADIEDSIEPFTSEENVMLCLAGRYDGLDLPGDDCRLLIMIESPAAVGALERHMRERWKLGPLFRRRERVRLIQGMGRCTRDATDYAVIILLGQSLMDSVTTRALTQGLPGEIQRELTWGIEQSELVKKNKNAISEMVLGLLTDSSYRKEANESLEEVEVQKPKVDSASYEESGKLEVQFSKALWEENFSMAYDIARNAADKTNEAELAGYRAWWFYLSAIAAYHNKDLMSEIDCLKRARATGINTGYLDYLLRIRSKESIEKSASDITDQQAEAIWNRLEEWGWHGLKFGEKVKEMEEGLAALSNPTQYHIGLERLGECLGAEVLRNTAPGTPDVVWIFPDSCFTFEVKCNKEPKGALSKKELQQAKGHPDWLRSQRESLKHIPIQALIVSPTRHIDDTAMPHAGGLNYISTNTILEFSSKVSKELGTLRTRYSGKEYGAVKDELKAAIKQAQLDYETIKAMFNEPLLKA